MVFDPDMEDDPMCRGFTSMSPDDLPLSIPSRSLADNMESQNIVTGAMRTRNFSRNGSSDGHVTAYKSAQFGAKPGENDARYVDLPKVGNFKDNGLGEYSAEVPSEMYEDADSPKKEVGDDDE